MCKENNPHQYQHNTDNKSVPIEQFKPDKKTICSRLEQDIPPQLAEVVPAEMDIIANGTSFDGIPIYGISKVLACGTAEDIIEFILDNYLFCCPGLDADIIKVGAITDGPLYIIRENLCEGRVENILDYFRR